MDEIATQSVDETVEADYASPGTVLRQARVSLGASQKDIAEKLHITVYKLDALESDQYEKVGVDTFIRGYLRSYAKLMEIGCDDIIKNYEEYMAALRATAAQVVNTEQDEEPSKPNYSFSSLLAKTWFKPGALLVSLALLWIIGFSLFSSGSPQDSGDLPMARLNDDTPPPQYPVDTDQATAAEIMAELRQQTNSAMTHASTTKELTEAVPLGNEGSDDQLAPDAGQNTSQTSEQQPVLTTKPDDHLVLKFSDESWVKISNKQGVVFEGIKDNGEEVTVDKPGPFDIVLGNARGVTVELNGKMINSDPIGTRKTRRLHIGV